MDSWLTLTERIEHEVRSEIDSRSRDRWLEDAITDALVARIRRVLSGCTVAGPIQQSRIAAGLYKARGAVENRFGDLAVLLSFQFRDGSSLEGVAFYEAKLRAWDGPSLPSANKAQVQRLNKNLWNGHLLVYDREPIVGTTLNALERPETASYVHPLVDADIMVFRRHPTGADKLPFTNAAAIPLNAVLALDRYDTSLYKLAVPFAHQLCLRNLQGLDLEHEPSTIAMAKGQSAKYDVPPVVLSVAVRQGYGEGEPQLPQLNDAKLQFVPTAPERDG